MFTGIVEEKGQVTSFAPAAAAWRLEIAAQVATAGVALGDSIAVNGCCLTVVEFTAHSLAFDVLEETRRLTNFSALGPGAAVNLERSLRFDGKIGGHFVSGHVDGLGRITAFEGRGKDHYLRVAVPSGMGRYLIVKGSIAIDGISLTVAEVAADEFAVWLIPHTLAVTSLGGRGMGEAVNLEFDLLGKYVEKLLSLVPAKDQSMRTAINALTEELRRLKGVGVKSVTVSDASLLALKRAVGAGAPAAAAAGGARSPSFAQPTADKPNALSTPAIGAEPKEGGTEGGTRPPGALGSPAVRASVPGGHAPPSEPAFPPPPVVVLPASGSKLERWTALKALVEGDEVCQKNVRTGKKIVLGVGSLDAKIMFVGEAPGAEEEIQGEPFVGPAGQLLTKMIQAMGLRRSDVYIGNIMNWRPQMPTDPDGVQYGNRPPTGAELAYCLPYLLAQIEMVAPAYLVALGATASHGLLGAGAFKALGEVRGKWREYAGRPLMITYHPSYILRNPTNRSKRMIWDDLLQVMERAALPVSDKQRGFFLDK